MENESSYKIQTIASDVDKEIQRLKAQVHLFWPKEFKHYVEYGLKEGMKVVELGSGPGFVTEKLFSELPGLKITCVEIETLLIEYAQKYLEKKKLKNYEIFHGSIMDTGLPADSFDFAVIRLVIEHLPDPVGAIREVRRILKPGGKAVFIDNDFEMHITTVPDIMSLRILYDAYCKSRYSEGGNPKIGRELPALLKEGGFQGVDFEIITAHSDILGIDMFLKSEGIGIPSKLVSDGFLSSKDMAKIAVEWRDVMKAGNRAIIRQLYMGIGTK